MAMDDNDERCRYLALDAGCPVLFRRQTGLVLAPRLSCFQ